ncbi:MAG: hypothetical protein Fur002_03380 [Anaerolineales bacterium]
MSACATPPQTLPAPPTAAAEATPTIQWFPPTPTLAPAAQITRAPTPDLRPNLGAVILSDAFSDPAHWDTASSNEASAKILNGGLTLAAQSGYYLFSLRRETLLSDYYVELSAAPNLCRAEDSYGLLARANAVAYYRFSLFCNGSISAEKVSGGSREVLQKTLPSGDAPLGAGLVRMGLWAQGGEMRFFLNGRYQFSIQNESYPSGSLGAFINAAGATPVIVTFSDLVVQRLTAEH